MISPNKSLRREFSATRRRRGSVEATTCLDMMYIRLGGDRHTPRAPAFCTDAPNSVQALSPPPGVDAARTGPCYPSRKETASIFRLPPNGAYQWQFRTKIEKSGNLRTMPHL
jgi:hypothetical protein